MSDLIKCLFICGENFLFRENSTGRKTQILFKLFNAEILPKVCCLQVKHLSFNSRVQ